MSTPRLRAACKIGVPIGNRPRRPDGMNATSAVATDAAVGVSMFVSIAADPVLTATPHFEPQRAQRSQRRSE
jgi:hypothetical protein